jgi:hypothetical protein
MSVVVSVKVPRQVKEEMEKTKDSVKWAEEIRGFIMGKLEEESRRKGIEDAERVLHGVRRLPKGTAEQLVREDRDSHH